jgi:hypothetical protein
VYFICPIDVNFLIAGLQLSLDLACGFDDVVDRRQGFIDLDFSFVLVAVEKDTHGY